MTMSKILKLEWKNQDCKSPLFSVGFVAKETSKAITLAMSYRENKEKSNNYSGLLVIYKKDIINKASILPFVTN